VRQRAASPPEAVARLPGAVDSGTPVAQSELAAIQRYPESGVRRSQSTSRDARVGTPTVVGIHHLLPSGDDDAAVQVSGTVAADIHWASIGTTLAALLAALGAVWLGMRTLRESRHQAVLDAKRAAYADTLVTLFTIQSSVSLTGLADPQRRAAWSEAVRRAETTIVLLGGSATQDAWQTFGREYMVLGIVLDAPNEFTNVQRMTEDQLRDNKSQLLERIHDVARAMRAELDA
jgi:hypothetical protein